MSASASGTTAVMPAAASRSMMPAAVSTASRRPRCVSTATRRASAAGWAGGGVTRHSIGRGQEEPTDAATSTGAVGARRASSTKNSRLPAGPGSRLGTTAWVCQPRAAAASITPVTASTCSVGSSGPRHRRRAAPDPPRTAVSPSAAGIPRGSTTAVSAGSRTIREMNERSPTTRSTGRSGRRARAGGRGRSAARTSAPAGRDRISSTSWPCPTSTAITSRHPARRSTWVNPPVEAPASRAR